MSLILIADSAAQVVQDWRVIGIVTVGGLISLYIKQRGDGIKNRQDNAKVDEKVDEIKEQVVEVRDHVANGHHTNLRDDLTEVLRRTGLMETYLRLLPSQADISGLRTDIQGLAGRVDRLEGQVRSHQPPP